MILKHDLQDSIGIRLLHNHNLIQENEIMIENEELDESGQNCLVTFAAKSGNATNYSPNSWKLQNGDFHPLEYSSDFFVTSSANTIEKKQVFFDDFKTILEQLDVQEILGPCIIGRDFYKKYEPSMPSILAETSNEMRRANIVKYESDNKFPDDSLIHTTWLAVRSEDSSSPELVCKAACIAISSCVKDDKGNHSKVQKHNKGTHIKS